MLPREYLLRRRAWAGIGLAVIVALAAGASWLTDFDLARALRAFPEAAGWAVANFVPDAAAWRRLPKILAKLNETILMAVAASTVAALFALAFAIAGARTTAVHPWAGLVSRGIATVFRNIDVSAWALILLFSFGQSAYTGYLALFFVTFGFLVRVMIETIDEVSTDSVEALRATGAAYTAIISQSVIPACLPRMLSWLLFMIETNIRSATLVGILTGTGIGFQFDLYYKSFNYPAASLLVLVVVLAVLAIEVSSNAIRRAVL